MAEEDVRRYIEFEAPGLAMVENDVSEVVCFYDQCETRVEVDPSTLVPEDDGAVDLVAKVADMGEPLQDGGRDRVEIYCSQRCRNQRYSATGADHDE